MKLWAIPDKWHKGDNKVSVTDIKFGLEKTLKGLEGSMRWKRFQTGLSKVVWGFNRKKKGNRGISSE